MTSIAARVIGGSFIVSIGGSLTYWVQSQANQVEKDQRGSLLLRIGETVNAFIVSRKIADRTIAEKHVELISSISSKQYANNCSQLKNEQDNLATSYFKSYMSDTTLNVPTQPSVFRYIENSSIGLSKIEANPFRGGFIFSGLSSKINDAEAREQILKGQYIRCSTNLSFENDQSKSYEKVDVILTGTTNCKKCASFRNDFDTFRTDFMNDTVMSAAGIVQKKAFDPSYPLSNTPVFEVSQNKIRQVGNLSKFPEATKKTVRSGNYTLCNYYFLQKTEFNKYSYKNVGTVVAGVQNLNVCEALHIVNMKKLINYLKEENDK